MDNKDILLKIINFNHKGFDDIKKRAKEYYKHSIIEQGIVDQLICRMKYRAMLNKQLYKEIEEIFN